MTKQEKAKDKRLRKIYKKSLAEFNAQVAEQGGGCAICGRSFSEFIAFQDHFHGCCARRLKEYCGRCNRGLLCFQCNRFLVGIVERMNLPVDKLFDYVRKWEPILRASGAYDPKPKKKRKSK